MRSNEQQIVDFLGKITMHEGQSVMDEDSQGFVCAFCGGRDVDFNVIHDKDCIVSEAGVLLRRMQSEKKDPKRLHKVHKAQRICNNPSWLTVCGRPITMDSPKTAEWEEVTCKQCLRMGTPKKDTDQ